MDDQTIPIVEFDTLIDEARARGVDLHDVLGGHGHFGAWMKRNRLPQIDPDGKDASSSQVYMTRYREDPDGEASCPAHVDIWHELLELAEPVAWTEHPGYRCKEVTVHPLIVRVPADPTEDELAAMRKRLESKTGALDDLSWDQVAQEARSRRIRAEALRDAIAAAAERHGIETDHGHIVRIGMRVDC